jgi:hypothetical protein
MGKLRELASSGDAQAIQRVADLDSIVVTHNIAGSLDFEKRVLDMAKSDFELISQNEYQDLSRLFEDRHRCAHPSLNRPGEVYRPTAEAARSHLRMATDCLLSQGPVQGKAALLGVLGEIESQLFPTDAIKAIQVLRPGALGKPRDVLLRSVVYAVISSLLTDDKSWQQKIAALLALRQLHRIKAESFIEKRIAEKSATLEEGSLGRLVRFVANVDDTWQYLPGPVAHKLQAYVTKIDAKKMPRTLLTALRVRELHEGVCVRVSEFSVDEATALLTVGQPRELVDRAIELYGESASYEEANRLKQKTA